MASIFTKIINKEIPAQFVYESDTVVAFMDNNPVSPGHVLVVPKQEVDNLFDLDDDTYLEVMRVVKKLAKAIEKAKNPPRVGLMVLGFVVPHAHVHVMPLESEVHIGIHRSGEQRSSEDLAKDAEEVKGAL